jgi:hypothetical protein
VLFLNPIAGMSGVTEQAPVMINHMFQAYNTSHFQRGLCGADIPTGGAIVLNHACRSMMDFSLILTDRSIVPVNVHCTINGL